MQHATARFRFRVALAIFVAGLVASGLTAFPLLTEVRLLASAANGLSGPIASWILTVQSGLSDTYAKYPWIAYGTDWLAFGHLTIALFFAGAFANPAAARTR